MPPFKTSSLHERSRSLLALRPNCELCDVDLPPDALNARICSYECTFCSDCVENRLHNVCPNCGGGFVPRPIRPKTTWREGTGLAHDPPDTQRRRPGYSDAELDAFVETVRGIPPEAR
jgi:hypothetical protein